MQRKVRCHITGMQRYDHINAAIGEYVLGHIGLYKFQTLVTVLLCDLTAALDYILFQIIADDSGFDTPLHCEVVVQDKGQITLSATKVQNGNVVLAIILESVIDQFNEPVDLLVLVVLGSDDLIVGGKDTQIHQCGNVLTLFEDVFLFPVMALDATGQGDGSGRMALVAAVCLHGVLDGFCIRHHQTLAVATFQLVFHDLQQLLGSCVLVIRLVIPKTLQLIAHFTPQQHRPNGNLAVIGLVHRLAEHSFTQPGESSFKICQKSCHIIHRRASSAAEPQPSAHSWSRSCWGQP